MIIKYIFFVSLYLNSMICISHYITHIFERLIASKLIANTTSVSHGVPCWLAALFDLLKELMFFESESKNRK